MMGVSPETWPVLMAFMALLTVLVFPLIRHIDKLNVARLADKDAAYQAQILELRQQNERLREDRERAYRERDRFIDLAVEGADVTRVAQDTAQRVTAVVERTRGPR